MEVTETQRPRRPSASSSWTTWVRWQCRCRFRRVSVHTLPRRSPAAAAQVAEREQRKLEEKQRSWEDDQRELRNLGLAFQAASTAPMPGRAQAWLDAAAARAAGRSLAVKVEAGPTTPTRSSQSHGVQVSPVTPAPSTSPAPTGFAVPGLEGVVAEVASGHHGTRHVSRRGGGRRAAPDLAKPSPASPPRRSAPDADAELRRRFEALQAEHAALQSQLAQQQEDEQAAPAVPRRQRSHGPRKPGARRPGRASDSAAPRHGRRAATGGKSRQQPPARRGGPARAPSPITRASKPAPAAPTPLQVLEAQAEAALAALEERNLPEGELAQRKAKLRLKFAARRRRLKAEAEGGPTLRKAKPVVAFGHRVEEAAPPATDRRRVRPAERKAKSAGGRRGQSALAQAGAAVLGGPTPPARAPLTPLARSPPPSRPATADVGEVSLAGTSRQMPGGGDEALPAASDFILPSGEVLWGDGAGGGPTPPAPGGGGASGRYKALRSPSGSGLPTRGGGAGPPPSSPPRAPSVVPPLPESPLRLREERSPFTTASPGTMATTVLPQGAEDGPISSPEPWEGGPGAAVAFAPGVGGGDIAALLGRVK